MYSGDPGSILAWLGLRFIIIKLYITHSGINLLDGEGASILHRAIECDSQEDNLELVKYLVEE